MKNVFAKTGLSALGIAVLTALAAPSPAIAETYQEYLSRLRDVCSAECMEPRQFQLAARKRGSGEEADMALIMDVAAVRLNGEKYELLSMDLQYSPLEELAILGSAGINTSSRNGIGGLPSARRGGTDPNLIIVQLDQQTFSDILNVATPLVQGEIRREEGEGIVVEGTREKELVEPSLTRLRTYFRNRRVVVRGKPELEAVFIGARRDFRRKQVTLVVDNPDDVVLLPRYDDDGEPVFDPAE